MADYDAAEAILDLLQTSTATGAAAIRNLLARGANSIVEARDFDESDVREAEDDRRILADDAQGVALLLTVEDLGDDPDENRVDHEVQFVGLRIYDRQRGYANIRKVRKAIRDWLFSEEAWEDTALTGAGILSLGYGGRSGHTYSAEHGVELEAISVRAQVIRVIETYD